MNTYELALVVPARLDEETRAGVVEKAKGYITRFGGTITETEEWGKRKLAYEIQKHTEAYYYFIHFEAEGTCPGELEKRMRIMDNVLRYLIVSTDENDKFRVTPDRNQSSEKSDETEEIAAEAAAVTAEAAAEAAEEAVEEAGEAAEEAVTEAADEAAEAAEEAAEAVEETAEAAE